MADLIFMIPFAAFFLFILNSVLKYYQKLNAFRKAQAHCTYGMHIDEIRRIMGTEWLEREGYVYSGNYVLEYRLTYKWRPDYEFVRFIFDQNNRMCDMSKNSLVVYTS